jgi:hypothetical protein
VQEHNITITTQNWRSDLTKILECVVAEFWSVGVLLRCLGSRWRRLWVPFISPRGLGASGFSVTIWKPKNFLSTSALDRTTRVDRSTDWCPSFPGWQRTVRWRHWVWWPKLAVGALGEEQSSRWRDCPAHTGLFCEFYKLISWDQGLRPYEPLDRPVHHWASPHYRKRIIFVGRNIFVGRPTKIRQLFSSAFWPTKIVVVFVGRNIFVDRPTKITTIFVGLSQAHENKATLNPPVAWFESNLPLPAARHPSPRRHPRRPARPPRRAIAHTATAEAADVDTLPTARVRQIRTRPGSGHAPSTSSRIRSGMVAVVRILLPS